MPEHMPRWPAFIRQRLAGASLDDDVVDEIAEHLDEIYAPASDPAGRGTRRWRRSRKR
ncbi:MAG: hypothetical protein H0W08_20975 [Acidobacteria bacterium]|nr:hypothetical protein [Acidobacteriota bacterium]